MVSVYEWLRQVNEQVWDSRQWPNRTPEDKDEPPNTTRAKFNKEN